MMVCKKKKKGGQGAQVIVLGQYNTTFVSGKVVRYISRYIKDTLRYLSLEQHD